MCDFYFSGGSKMKYFFNNCWFHGRRKVLLSVTALASVGRSLGLLANSHLVSFLSMILLNLKWDLGLLQTILWLSFMMLLFFVQGRLQTHTCSSFWRLHIQNICTNSISILSRFIRHFTIFIHGSFKRLKKFLSRKVLDWLKLVIKSCCIIWFLCSKVWL